MGKRMLVLALVLATGHAHGVVLFESDFSGFSGSGLAPGGVGGTLDSSRWSVQGLSDGDSATGDTRLSGDFARGTSPGGVSGGGLYAFVVPGALAGVAPGFQPTGADFTPGALVLSVANDSGAIVDAVDLAFALHVHDNGGRSTALRVELDVDGTWVGIPGFATATPAGAGGDGAWSTTRLSGGLMGLGLEPGEPIAVRWLFDDTAGRGTRDEVALDAVTLTAVARPAPPPTVLPEPGTAPLLAAALACAMGMPRARRAVLPILNPPASRQ